MWRDLRQRYYDKKIANDELSKEHKDYKASFSLLKEAVNETLD